MTRTKGQRIWLPGNVIELLHSYMAQRGLAADAAIGDALTVASHSLLKPVSPPVQVVMAQTEPLIQHSEPQPETQVEIEAPDDDEFEIDLFADNPL